MKAFNLNDYSDIRESMYIQASAGTGKTFTITGIIEKLIKQNIKLNEILVVTYTEKAAGELRDRIRKACPGEDVDNAPIFTIHSFCTKTLSEFSFTANQCANLGLVDDTALDDFIDRWIRDELKENKTFKELFCKSDKQSSFINSIKKDFKASVTKYYLNNNYAEDSSIISFDDIYVTIEKKDFVHTYTFQECLSILNETGDNYQSLVAKYNLPFGGKTVDSVIKKIDQFYIDYNTSQFYKEQTVKLYLAWQQEKERNKVQDYDDMLRSVREAVCEKDSRLRKQLQKKYKCAIIDEFQDTNQKQWDIFKTIFMEDSDHFIIVVGDPKQSIYAFQGADVNVYLNAVQSIAYHGGEAYTLDTNYRSTDAMVEACNLLFDGPYEGNETDKSCFFFNPDSKIQFTHSKPSSAKVAATYCNKETQPLWIAGTPNQNTTEQDFAKLTVQTIIDCCSYENGKTKLQVSAKDKTLRDVSFRDFAILARSSSEFDETERALKMAGIPFLRYKDANLFAGRECIQWIALFNAITSKDFTGYKRSVLSEVLFTDFFKIPLEEVENEIFDNPTCPQRQMIIQWQLIAQQRKWAKLLEKIYADTDIENRLSKLDQMQTLTKIRQIGNYAVDYLYKNDSSIEDVSKHLLRLSTNSDSSIDEGNLVEKGTDFDSVQLMTIHASKGLEFPVVIVPAGLKARNNNIPHVYLYHDENKKAKLNYSDYGKTHLYSEEDYERERLYYVAYTRASSVLMLPFYDVWESAPRNEKAKVYAFLKNNISNLFESKGKEFIHELNDNHKDFSELQTDVQKILAALKEKRKQSASEGDGSPDLTQNEQLEATKSLTQKVPELTVQKHSYSSLSHGAGIKAAAEAMTEDGGRSDKEGEVLQQSSLSSFDASENPVIMNISPATATPAPLNYPKGTKLGIAVHEVFEKADFEKHGKFADKNAAAKDESLQQLISFCFERQTLAIAADDPDNWLSYTTSILWNTLNAKLPEIFGVGQTGQFFKLSELPAGDKISEAEFNMNTELVDSDNSEILKNYCNGFVDLIFKRTINGKDVYSVLDWKSDTFEQEQYSDSAVLKAHTDDRYSIQRVLYSYTLIKWLKNFYKDESETQIFENHFGGIYYVYIRGCQAENSSGIYARTWKNWSELENAYKKILNELIIKG